MLVHQMSKEPHPQSMHITELFYHQNLHLHYVTLHFVTYKANLPFSPHSREGVMC